MKKVLVFGATIKLSLDNQSGIMKKVFGQSKAFESEYDVYTWGFSDNEILYVHNGEITVVAKFKNKMERREKYFIELTRFVLKVNASVFYFRYASADFYLLSALKKFKETGVVCIIEIPSYPYKGEFRDTFKKRLIYLLDTMLRGKLKKYVSRVVIFVENPKEIYGIPCINTMNGIDCDAIKPVCSVPGEVLNMIAVASMLPHHGFDRMIEGLHRYYSAGEVNQKVVFHVVGNGQELCKYKSICDSYSLNDYVHFYGQKTGNDLDEIFNISDIAVGSLGLHRIGITEGSTLKNREYAVRGLPIVYATYELFLKDSVYALELPSDDTPVNIQEVIEFWNKTKTISDIHTFIRNDAVEKCDMRVIMKPVLNFIKTEFEKRKI